MQPFAALGLPSPDECLGIVGLLVGLAVGLAGLGWLLLYAGGFWAWALVVGGGLLGSVSFMYCEVWEQSLPVG